MVPCGVQPLRTGMPFRTDQELQHRGEDHNAHRRGEGEPGFVRGEQRWRFMRKLFKALSVRGYPDGQKGSFG